MKINKLKAFFIIAILAFVLPFATINKSVALDSPKKEEITYPPKSPPKDYEYFAYYNICNQKENSRLLCASKGKNINILYSADNMTYLATFDKNGYKQEEKVIYNHPSSFAKYFNNIWCLIVKNKVIFLDNDFKELLECDIVNGYKLDIIDGQFYIFCLGHDEIVPLPYGKIIYHNYEYIENVGKYFVFKLDNEVLITDFVDNLYFETEKYHSLILKNDVLYFFAYIGKSLVLTTLKDFEIVYTKTFDDCPTHINIEAQENGINLYFTLDKTYKYFICNHGDIISKDIFCEDKLISLDKNIYQKGNYYVIQVNEKIINLHANIYNVNHIMIDDYIVFESKDFVYKSASPIIYIAKWQ